MHNLGFEVCIVKLEEIASTKKNGKGSWAENLIAKLYMEVYHNRTCDVSNLISWHRDT